MPAPLARPARNPPNPPIPDRRQNDPLGVVVASIAMDTELPGNEPPTLSAPPASLTGVGEIDSACIRLFALVGEALSGATHSLLAGDRDAARAVAERDDQVDALYREVEDLAFAELVRRGSDIERVKHMVVILRLLPEVERSGDLAASIARRAIRGLGVELSHRARGLVERMGEVAISMWGAATEAFAYRSPTGGEELETLDDEMDELHVTLTAEIASGSMSLPVAIEAALVARFYERFGDHAVNLARRVEGIAGAAG